MPKTRPQDGEAAVNDGPKEAQDPWDKRIKNFVPDSCNAMAKMRPKMIKLRPKMPKTRPQDGEDATKDGPKEARPPGQKK